jgi:hypothetical protein
MKDSNNKYIFNVMKIILLFLIIQNVCYPSDKEENHREWGGVVSGQMISIKANKIEYAAEERIILNVLYKNVGTKTGYILESGIFVMYDIKILMPNGREAQKTAYGKAFEPIVIAGMTVTATKPGEEKSRDIRISRYYDFSMLGTYTITIKQILYEDNKKMLYVTSNKLNITISDNDDNKPQ